MVNTPKSPHLPRQASSAAKGIKSSAAVVKGDQISLPSKKLLAIAIPRIHTLFGLRDLHFMY